MNLEKLKYKKFKGKKPKILLITSKYFLIGEIINALKKLDIEYNELILGNREYLTEDFLNIIIHKIAFFKPDFTFTINHLGVDREGVLTNLFEKIEMPLLSWYVDNPNLIIKHFRKNISDMCTILVWDKDNIEDMKRIGFKNVFYLPLGVDTDRFKFIPLENNPFSALKTDILFVGNSMIEKVKKSLAKTKTSDLILKYYKKIAVKFVETEERHVEQIIKKYFNEIYELYNLMDEVNKTNFETTITWEATRIYRYKCIKSILPFNSLIVGDSGWKTYFRNRINYHKEVIYYTELPYFYNLALINFNTTSLQMKNAVNQRVFDVPASKRFIITDYRRQLEDLFDIGKEIICYGNVDEIPELIGKYLKNEKEKKEIIKRGYKRVIAKHKYTHRVKSIIDMARNVYS